MARDHGDAPGASVAPMLSVRRGALAVDFYKTAFGARELFRLENGGGAVVAQLSVQGARFWVADESPEHLNFSPESLNGSTARFVMVVDDPAAVFAAAITAGAREISPVQEEHGWYIGRLVDPFGHHWEIGRPLRDGVGQ
jgi:PhnB protein